MRINTASVQALAVDLGRAGATASVRAGREIARSAFIIEGQAKARCPVDTGTLRSSISTTVSGMSAEIGPTAAYGGYVENGTSRMRPQPYMGPAADAEFPRLEQRIATILGGLL